MSQEGFGSNPLDPANNVTRAAKTKATVNKVRVFSMARNHPRQSATIHQPVTFDHAGTGYTFHPLGPRFKLVKVTIKQQILNTDGEPADRKYSVEKWMVDKDAPEMKEGENGVDVPIGAWIKWTSNARDQKKMRDHNGNTFLKTSTDLAANVIADLTSMKATLSSGLAAAAEAEARAAAAERAAAAAEERARLAEERMLAIAQVPPAGLVNESLTE